MRPRSIIGPILLIAIGALFLLNNPFVQEQARGVMRRVNETQSLDTAAKIQALHRVVYGRAAEPDEVRLGEAYLQSAAADQNGLTAWERYAQVLLLANEFMFVD